MTPVTKIGLIRLSRPMTEAKPSRAHPAASTTKTVEYGRLPNPRTPFGEKNTMTNPFSLEGKVALVTGANTGLGQGIAVALAAAGADIASAGIVPADETGEKVRALGRRFVNIDANLISIEPVA